MRRRGGKQPGPGYGGSVDPSTVQRVLRGQRRREERGAQLVNALPSALYGGSPLILRPLYPSPNVLDIASPSLLRCNAISDSASNNPGNDYGDNRIWAQLSSEDSDDNLGVEAHGPYLYLSKPGRWSIYWDNTASVAGPPNVGFFSLWQNMSPAEASIAMGSVSFTETVFVNFAAATPRVAIGAGNSVTTAFGCLARLFRVSCRYISGGPVFLDFGVAATPRFSIVAGVTQFDWFPVLSPPIGRSTAAGTMALHCSYR